MRKIIVINNKKEKYKSKEIFNETLKKSVMASLFSIGDLIELSPFAPQYSAVYTISELQNSNLICLSGNWKNDCQYYEHPKRHFCFIEKNMYNSYILNEIINELINYISSYMDLDKVVIGLMHNSNYETQVSVPIKEVNTSAKIEGSINAKYNVSVSNIKKLKDRLENPIWLNSFSTIINAVEKEYG